MNQHEQWYQIELYLMTNHQQQPTCVTTRGTNKGSSVPTIFEAQKIRIVELNSTIWRHDTNMTSALV